MDEIDSKFHELISMQSELVRAKRTITALTVFIIVVFCVIGGLGVAYAIDLQADVHSCVRCARHSC